MRAEQRRALRPLWLVLRPAIVARLRAEAATYRFQILAVRDVVEARPPP